MTAAGDKELDDAVVGALHECGWTQPRFLGGDGLLYSVGVRRGALHGLATITPPHDTPAATLSARFAFSYPGIAPLAVIQVGRDFSFVVEEIPGGPSAAELAATEALGLAVGRTLLRTVAPMHAAGKTLGGIRPERVVLPDADAPDRAVIAPRWEPFAAAARPSSVGIAPLYSEPYLSREMILGMPVTPASDVFAIAATVVRLASGRHPFGDGFREVVQAIANGVVPTLALPGIGAAQRELLSRALSGEASARPSAAELALAL